MEKELLKILPKDIVSIIKTFFYWDEDAIKFQKFSERIQEAVNSYIYFKHCILYDDFKTNCLLVPEEYIGFGKIACFFNDANVMLLNNGQLVMLIINEDKTMFSRACNNFMFFKNLGRDLADLVLFTQIKINYYGEIYYDGGFIGEDFFNKTFNNNIEIILRPMSFNLVINEEHFDGKDKEGLMNKLQNTCNIYFNGAEPFDISDVFTTTA